MSDVAMRVVFLVFLGGGIGSALRHTVNVAFTRWFGTSFPFQTLFENVSGSLVMGLLATYFTLRTGSSQSLRLFLTTGIVGGYTTFSAFSLDSMLLWERGQYGAALAYVVLSIAAAIAGLVLGTVLLRALG